VRFERAAWLALGALALASCSSPSSTATTTTTSASTTNLVVSSAVRSSLLDAAAKYHQLPPKDYVGLDPRMTYYAFDPATDLYYAAAGLRPSPHSLAAQVGTQDDGGYNLFTRAPHAAWTVYNDGLGAAQGDKCPIKIPASVLAVWDWHAGSCFPPL
jgi:hypothetical protein